jgi:PAS domain S-box
MNLSNEISENALMLETIFDHTHFMIAYLDKNFDFIGVNKAYAKKSNKSPDFFVGKNHFDLYPHKGNERIFKNVVKTGKPYYAYSMPLEHSELGVIYWDWVIQPVKEDGEVTGLLLSLTDVTDYKRDEDSICKNQREFLDKLVENRAHDLLTEQEKSNNSSLEAANSEIEDLNNEINELKKSNDEFKEIISKYKISEKEHEDSIGKQVNEILEKQVAAEELLAVKNSESKKKDQTIAELEKNSDKFKEIISKYEDSAIENEKFIKNLTEAHNKELEDIKKNVNTSESLDENIIDNISDALITADSKLRITMWNSAAQDIYGWSEDEVTGKLVYDVFKSKESPIERLKILEYLRTNNYLHSEFVHHSREGKPLNIKSTITVKYDDNGHVIKYMLINQDISELKSAEELLTASNSEVMQLNQKVTELEKSSTEFKEILSKYENSEKLFEKRINEVLRKQKEAKELLDTKKLRVEELNQNIALLENSNEELSAYISKLKDSAESQKNIYEEQLEKLTDNLNRSNEEFQQFAYVTSHDLQEPLRTIASFTQLLAKRHKNKIDEDSDEFMEYIVDASTRMQGMIKDLLQYSRVVSRGKVFKQTNAEEIVEYAISSLKTQIEDNDAEITYDKLPTVNVDSSQLLQLLQNLVENSIKFRQFTVQPKIHISCSKQGNEYVFSVADNGIGIEEQYFSRIFTIFQRLHTKEEYEGTGIGLAVAKRIVERHNGHIWVESEPDIGSTFYFTIPN